MRRLMFRDGAVPAATLCLRSALPATLCFNHFGRSWQPGLETKKFLRLSRQDYGSFPANICFKPQRAQRLYPSDSQRKRHTAIAPNTAAKASSAPIGPRAASKPEPRQTIASSPSTAQRVGYREADFLQPLREDECRHPTPAQHDQNQRHQDGDAAGRLGRLPEHRHQQAERRRHDREGHAHARGSPAKLPSIRTPNTTRAKPNTVSMMTMATIAALAARLPMIV